MKFKFTKSYLNVGEKGKLMRIFCVAVGFSQWCYTQTLMMKTHVTKKFKNRYISGMTLVKIYGFSLNMSSPKCIKLNHFLTFHVSVEKELSKLSFLQFLLILLCKRPCFHPVICKVHGEQSSSCMSRPSRCYYNMN